LQSEARSQSRQERRAARLADSAQPKNIQGGVTFQQTTAYVKAYESILNHLKRKGYTIDSADERTGQLITALDITGKYNQTGTRLRITLIKDSDSQTTVRVAVT